MQITKTQLVTTRQAWLEWFAKHYRAEKETWLMSPVSIHLGQPGVQVECVIRRHHSTREKSTTIRNDSSGKRQNQKTCLLFPGRNYDKGDESYWCQGFFSMVK